MRFKDKYTKPIKAKINDKVEISAEAYAIGELLEQILDKLEHVRLSK